MGLHRGCSAKRISRCILKVAVGSQSVAAMTTTEAINEMVFDATVAKIKDYCETRLAQGASNDQLNAELKRYIPHINVWSRRQRMLLKLATEMMLTNRMTMQ